MSTTYYNGFRQLFFKLLQGSRIFFKSGSNFVLCYHSFSGRGNSFTISPKAFREQIKELSKSFKFVSLDQITDPRTKNSIAITVDDGYADIFSVLPTIQKYKIPVTLFLMADPLKANRIELDHPGKLLTNPQIKKLQKLGFTIGCHSMTHANFAELTKKELFKEIVEAKKVLEKKIKNPVQYFAYPKGVFTSESVKLVKKAGFQAAFTVLPGHVNRDLMLLPRTIIDEFYSPQDITILFNPIFVAIKNMMSKYKLWRFVVNI